MTGKNIITAIAALGVCTVMAGCGSKTIDLNEYVEITCEGYDSVGTAKADIDIEELVADNMEAFGIEDEDDWYDAAKILTNLEKYIDGEFDKEDGLSNGDKVTFTWDVKKDKVKEKYSVNLKYSDITVEVDELDEAKELDPFEYISVSFSGYSPSGTIDIGREGSCPVSGLSYTADKTDSLSNGDKVVVTVDVNGADMDEYCLSQGYILSRTEQEYTVEGLAAYVSKVSEIPAETLEKMKADTEDRIKAQCASDWNEGNTVSKLEYVGYYSLARKNGVVSKGNNFVYLVYKVTASFTGYSGEDDETVTKVETYYTYCRYRDIMLLEDGTCTLNYDNVYLNDDHREESTVRGGRYSSGYRFYGYYSLDTMFNDCVTKNIDEYSYETTVQ